MNGFTANETFNQAAYILGMEMAIRQKDDEIVQLKKELKTAKDEYDKLQVNTVRNNIEAKGSDT